MPSSNPFVEARREWDERYADLVLGKRNRQIAAGGLLAATLILASGIVWQATRSRYIPYIVEVDKLGYALTIPQPLTASGTSDAEARIVRYEIATFIRNARSVSDPQVEQQQLNSLLSPGRSTPRVVDSPSSRSGMRFFMPATFQKKDARVANSTTPNALRPPADQLVDLTAEQPPPDQDVPF
jgi:hypothetical protein